MSESRRWGAIAIAVSLLWISLLYGEVLKAPDNYMFSSKGDGIKNYFTFAWHVRYDTNWLEFEGMNQPYGEHVGYTDGHPLFSLLFGDIPWVKQHPVGFLNVCMLVSILVTVWLLYRLLIRWKVNPWIACIGALGITWLQPQLFRMEGHLALSYAWSIPGTLLLLTGIVGDSARAKTRNAVGLFLYLTAVFFIHPYLGMICSTAGLAAAAFFGLRHLRNGECRISATLLLISSLVPVLVYLAFMRLTDPHTGRAPDADGFLVYRSNIESVFVPNHGPFRHMISQVIKVREQIWEGWSYVGVATMLLLLFALVMTFTRYRNLIWKHSYSVLLMASVLVLLFSFAVPFIWGLEDLLEKIPYIEQFRAPGRFAWVFYFIATTWGVIIVDRYTEGKRKRRMILASAWFALMLIEGYAGQMEVARNIAVTPNEFREELLDEEHRRMIEGIRNISAEESSVLIPLPFFHYGSDYFGRWPTLRTTRDAFIYAYHTGVPLVASANPRVSLDECASVIGLLGEPDEEKALSKAFAAHPSTRMILFRNGLKLPDDDEVKLWQRCGSDTAAGDGLRWSSVDRVLRDKSSYEQTFDTLLSDPWVTPLEGWLYIRKSSESGSVTLDPGAYYRIATCVADSGWYHQDRVLHLEMTAENRMDLVFTYVIVESMKGGEFRWAGLASMVSSPGFTETGVRATVPFRLEPGEDSLRVVIKNNNDYPIRFEIGESYIRPARSWWKR